MSRYIVIGAGAVGATVAAQLAGVGVDVTVVARGAHLAALRANGLRYVRPDGIRQVRLNTVDAVDTVGGTGELTLDPDDVLVLATKAQDTEAALAQWAWQPVPAAGRAAGEILPIVLMQNGLEGARTALRRFATVLDAVVLIPSSHPAPGEVVSPGAPIVGAFYLDSGLPSEGVPSKGVPSKGVPSKGVIVEEIAADLRRGGFAVQVVTEIARWKAGKLLGNIPYNLDALYPPSALRTRAGQALRDEAEAVLVASGVEPIDLQAAGKLDLSGFVVREIPGFERGGSSTWQSLARAGAPESDFLYGEIALRARLVGLPAPLNTAIQARMARLARDGQAPGSLDDADLAETLATLRTPAPVLVEAKNLHDELRSDRPPVLLDVRWALGDPDGQAHYREGHLPGAVYVDLETELAAPAAADGGRHPLPEIETLQDAARRWGVSDAGAVVVYDDAGGLAAARAWWLLRWAGVTDVRILDGALAAWTAAGYDLETGGGNLETGGHPEPGDVTLSPGHLPTLTADQTAALPATGILLDARAGERYRGEVEPVDPKAGHIPGARSAPTTGNLAAEGTFLSPDELRTRFAGVGVEARTAGAGDPGQTVGVYCGSGVTAAHQIAALAVAGIPAALYPGSWSAWSADETRPVATGPTPSAGSSPQGAPR